MSCLDNTDILRIVGGNSFQIAITVKARRVSDGSEIEDFDLSASSPVLNLIHAGEKTRKYFVTQGNQAIISFSGSEGLGYYGMEMSGSYNSEAWRFCIEKVLQLVDTNAKANIPEWSFLVDDTYFIEGTISIYGGGGGGDTVQADWTESNPTSAAFILHKPDLSVYATKAEVASGLAGKQDTIVDLTSIRYGAAAGATAYQKPVTGIPESDMSDGVQSALDKADSAYQLPANGIPATDMSESVQAALEKANSAVQTETDPVFSNSPAAEISQTDINNWNAKQPAIADLADIREGAAAGATAVQPDEMAQAIDGVEGDIADINAKIPSTASNLNQLADKAYVNSSIATNSATYRGSFNLITDLGMNVDATHAQIAGALATAIVTADNNDYAFVQIPDSASTPTVIAKIERYKHNGTGWAYEYDLNNSGFTAAQWAAINSGITSGLVGKLADLPNNSELATLLNGKQNVINDLADIREGAAAGATAIQPSDLTEAINDVEDEIAGLDESKQDTIEDLSTIRSGAAAGATAYQKPASGIPESDMSEGVQTSLGKADSAYQKPVSGIPSADMSESVQASLAKANSAVQTETDPVFSNSPAAEISQADINSWNAKQSAIADLAAIREGAAAGATAVQPDEMAQAIDVVDGDIAEINAKIPSTASSLNQLADKAYVNSSIATNSATYRGSFNLITDLGMNVDATHAQIAGALATAIVTADNNDYAFVQIPDSASTPTVIAKIERYKHNGSGWVYEYDLNNSGFTAAQWAAINSGITSGLVGKLADLPNNSELATLLNGKQNVINDLAAIREGASAGATAVQPADLTEALNGVEAEIAGLDESKQDAIEDLSTIRSGAAAGATAYQKPVSGIPESDMSDGVQTLLGKADSAYQKPSSGIPATDMSESVQAALEKANSAVQTESDPVFSGSPAAEITQTDINAWNAKQSAIADLSAIREGAEAGATAVQPAEMAQAIDGVEGEIDAINAKIPSAASSLNQLADKAYVNSSIATNSATYRGSFNLITDLGMNIDATHAQIAGALATAIATADNNDYAFVQIPDSASTPTVIAKIERYKHNGSGWVYEYDLNNSGFTAAQWAAINSGITSGLVGKLADLPNNNELATLLNGKQNVINDLSAIRSGASAGATAYQKPSGGIPASDMSSTVQQDLSKANTAVQTETDPIFSASPAAGITAQNIQTWNGEPAARQAADNLLRTDLTSEQNARQAADAALQTAIQNETADRIAADALKVNRADVQDINSVAEPMTSTTNPISAHAMGVMKQYVDAEVSQTIITPTEGSIVADNATIESTEVETNVHQLAVKSNVFWTKGTNDVDDTPTYQSNKIPKSGGVYSAIINQDKFVRQISGYDFTGVIAELFIYPQYLMYNEEYCANVFVKKYGGTLYFRNKTAANANTYVWNCTLSYASLSNNVVYELVNSGTHVSDGVADGVVVGYVCFRDLSKATDYTGSNRNVNTDAVVQLSLCPQICCYLLDILLNITTNKLADGAVTTNKLADGAVTIDKTEFSKIYISDTDVYKDDIAELYVKDDCLTNVTKISLRCYSSSIIFRAFNGSTTLWTCSNSYTLQNNIVYELKCTTAGGSVSVGNICGYIVFKDATHFVQNSASTDTHFISLARAKTMYLQPRIESYLTFYAPDNSIGINNIIDYSFVPLLDGYWGSSSQDYNPYVLEIYINPTYITGVDHVTLRKYTQSLIVRAYTASGGSGGQIWGVQQTVVESDELKVIPLVATTAGGNVSVGDTTGYIVFKDVESFLGLSSDVGFGQALVLAKTTKLFTQPNIYRALKGYGSATSEIPDNAVTTSKIADGAVTTSKMADESLSCMAGYGVEIIMPDELPVVINNTTRIYWRSVVKCPNPYIFDIYAVCGIGKSYPRYFEVQPVSTGTTTATIYVRNANKMIVAQKSFTIRCVNSLTSPASNKNILTVGASATASGYIAGELKRRLTTNTGDGTTQNPTGLDLLNISFVGRKTGSQSDVHQEATGGWSWIDYSGVGRAAYRFFVSGVNVLSIGATFRDSNSNYVFTIVEINITNGSGEIRCTYTGSGTISQSGTLTKLTGDGDGTITYSSFDAENYNPFWNPDKTGGAGLDFVNYANLYCNGTISVLLSHCGMNDISRYTPTNIASLFTDYVKPFARAFHADFPQAKFVFSTLPLGSPNGGMAANYGANSFWNYYNVAQMLWALSGAAHDMAKETEFSGYFFVADVIPSFDCENLYPTSDKEICLRLSTNELLQSNGVHPIAAGSYTVADAIFNAINFIGFPQ